MRSLENNIITLKKRIDAACIQASRPISEVSLLAVSKTRPVDLIKLAYQSGLRQFGENYAAEAQEKIPLLPDDIIWHFIGPIQSNKSRMIAEQFSWVHSIDRLKIVQRLNNQRPTTLPPLQCLIQVNISKEPQKAGVLPEQVRELALAINESPQLNFRGLMAIPKVGQKTQDLRQNFAKMTALFSDLQDINKNVDTLSMGMSQDLELAIDEGSSLVRIGTDLFGPRI